MSETKTPLTPLQRLTAICETMLTRPQLGPLIVPDAVAAEIVRTAPRFRIDPAVLSGAMEQTVDLAEERARLAVEHFNRWLEVQLEQAFAQGMDYAVTHVVAPGDRAPKLSAETMGWTETLRWQGMMIEPGTSPGPLWTVFRCPPPPERPR